MARDLGFLKMLPKDETVYRDAYAKSVARMKAASLTQDFYLKKGSFVSFSGLRFISSAYEGSDLWGLAESGSVRLYVVLPDYTEDGGKPGLAGETKVAKFDVKGVLSDTRAADDGGKLAVITGHSVSFGRR